MPTIAHESGSPKITALRALLSEKFPAAEPKAAGVFRVDSPEIELRRGAVTEVCGSPGSGMLLLEGLIGAARAAGMMVALVDGTGGFDPAQCGRDLRHLLWVRCAEAGTAVKAADLLLRDGNIPLILLDLQMNADLRRIPATTWYRFQRIVEPTASMLVAFTPRPVVSSAVERIELHNRWTLAAMQRRRTELRLVAERVHRRAQAAPELRIA
ncbi:MAG: hypothetical protein ACFUZC_09670 [Chthoniobacteraceae bacterium]